MSIREVLDRIKSEGELRRCLVNECLHTSRNLPIHEAYSLYKVWIKHTYPEFKPMDIRQFNEKRESLPRPLKLS